ncbi:MAG TPA: hypothetical protein VMZ30_05375 [Pyrinomonadaceae bacterium]|nr:hypothetical protein [Pyrinomonadaceae bacterium]
MPQEGHLMLWAMAMISPSGSRLEVLLPMSNVIAVYNVWEQFLAMSLWTQRIEKNPVTGG